jgi:hypothetical protein
MEKHVAEIKLRAVRKIGEISRDLPTAQGARTELRGTDDTKLMTLIILEYRKPRLLEPKRSLPSQRRNSRNISIRNIKRV